MEIRNQKIGQKEWHNLTKKIAFMTYFYYLLELEDWV